MCTKRYIAKKLSTTLTAVTMVAAVTFTFAFVSTAHAQTIYPETSYVPNYFVPTQDYFMPQEMPNVIDSYYYDPYTPVFRSQRGRSTYTGPTTGDYDSNDNEPHVPMDHERYKNNVRSVFERIAADNTQYLYDNETLADARLDLRSLTTHTCFDPAGTELSDCTRRFGAFANLKKSILNGNLFSVLTEDDADSDMRLLYEQMIEQISEEENSTEITTVAEMLRESRKLRSQLLWEICMEMFPSYQSATECFQRNSRLALDRDLNMVRPEYVE